MHKLLAGIYFMALAGTLSMAAPPQDQDDRHDNGKHKGWDKHEDRDGDRHDNGKHKGWYKHGDRDDYRARRVVLYDDSNWVVANYDLDRCRDWEWDRDRVYVYDDDHHPGWYLLFNARLGRYVHVEYFGLH